MTFIADVRGVFVDTSAWISLMNGNERHHAAAVEVHRRLSPSTLRVTSWGVVAETYTWIRYHIGARDALRWLHLKETLERQGSLEVVFPEISSDVSVLRILDRFADQDLSYVDAFSILLMQSRPDIDAVFAFDHHLSLAGLSNLADHLG